MRKHMVIIGLLIFVYSCGNVLESPESLSKKVFEAIKTETFKNFKTCIPNLEDSKRYFNKIKSEGKLSKKDLKRVNQQFSKIESEIERLVKKHRKYFFRVLDRAEKEGIKWKDTEFKEVKFKIKEIERNGIKTKGADIRFYFVHKETVYEIELERCLKLGRGWLITNKMRWRGIFGKTGDGSHKYNLKKTMGDIKLLGTAFESYAVDNGFYPKVNSLKEIYEIENFSPFYIKKPVLLDAWGNNLLFKGSADGKSYSIGSPGRDKVFKGWDQKGSLAKEDFDEDIIYSNGVFVKAPRIR